MKGLVITNKGIEDIAALEIKELIKAKTFVKETVVIFEFNKYEDLFTLCYKGQSFAKVLNLYDYFEFNENQRFSKLKSKISINKKESLLKKLKKIIKNIKINKKKTFRVSCNRIGEHDFSSQEIENEVGKLIDLKCDLTNPDIIYYVYIYNNMCYFGVDISGLDLSKRDYKIFSLPNSLKATIAYALVRISGYKEGDVLLDPFCGSGEISIEAARFASNFPTNYYNKNKFKFKFDKIDKKIKKKIKGKICCFDYQHRNVKAAEKNAKIAGINKLLQFSRTETDFLELKFKDNVDVIVTQPPALSKYSDIKQIEKQYDEFFYQAEYILKKNGKIVVTSGKTEELVKKAEKYKFKVKEEREVFMGKRGFKVITFFR